MRLLTVSAYASVPRVFLVCKGKFQYVTLRHTVHFGFITFLHGETLCRHSTNKFTLRTAAQRTDDLTGGAGRVLQADVTVDGDLACRIYDSCKSVAIVGETTAMQSGLVRFAIHTIEVYKKFACA